MNQPAGDRLARIQREEEELGKAARIVKELLIDNATPYSTFQGTLSAARVAALKAILEAAGFKT